MDDTAIVFVGDSITDAGRRTDPDGWGDGYVRRLVPLARERFARVVNVGIAGDRVRDLRRRWAADVLAERPTLVSVHVGINDTWRRFDSDDPTSDESFETDYRAILDAAVDAGTERLVLLEPFLVPVRAEQHEWLDDLAGKRAVVAALAAEYGAVFVPLHSVFERAAGDGGSRLAPDGVHPSAAGSDLIAQSWRAAVLGA